MSKVTSRLKGAKKIVEKVVHGNYMATNILAGMAMAGPPLGPMLGQVKYIYNSKTIKFIASMYDV